MIFLLIMIVLVVIDCLCYSLAPYPQRKALIYKMPIIGGPLALI